MISGRNYFALLNGSANTPALANGKINVTAFEIDTNRVVQWVNQNFN